MYNFPLCKSLYLLHALPPPGIPFPLALPTPFVAGVAYAFPGPIFRCSQFLKSLAIYLPFYSFRLALFSSLFVSLPRPHSASFICVSLVVVSECSEKKKICSSPTSICTRILMCSPYYSYVIFNALTPQTEPCYIYSRLLQAAVAVAVIKADFFSYYKKTAFTVVARLLRAYFPLFCISFYFRILCTSLSSARIAR